MINLFFRRQTWLNSGFQKLDSDAKKKTRVESTRVDTDELIDELINDTDFQINDDSAESKSRFYRIS